MCRGTDCRLARTAWYKRMVADQDEDLRSKECLMYSSAGVIEDVLRRNGDGSCRSCICMNELLRGNGNINSYLLHRQRGR